MRLSKREMTLEDTKQLLERGEYGVLSLVSPNQSPYGVPMSYSVDAMNIYLHCASEGQKIDYIQNNPQACFTIVGSTQILQSKFTTHYESVIATGTLTFVDDPSEKEKALMGLINKYSPDFVDEGRAYISRSLSETTVLKLSISALSGKHRA